jgi:hypothetical protein
VIIIKLSGGLGNQLNYYHVSRYLSSKFNQDVKFDISLLKNDWQSIYYLSYLGLKLDIINKNIICDKEFELDLSSDFIFENGKSYLLNRIKTHPYQFIKKSNPLCLENLKINRKLNKNDINILKELKNTDSVAIHIRRGDYLNVKKTNEKFGVLPIEYYLRAIDYCEKEIDSPYYYFFSDDTDWVDKSFADIKNKFIVKHNKSRVNNGFDNYRLIRYFKRKTKCLFKQRLLNAVNDFFLMANCKHFIIANSTYSWWGAYLGDYKNKIVICPNKWSNYRISDLTVPDTWLKF